MSAEINWNTQFEGLAGIKVRSYNDCGISAWSEPHVTQVYTCMGVEEHGGGEAGKRGSLEIWPNPVREILNFKFSILNSGGDYSICIYDIFGREMLTNVSPSPVVGEGRGGGWQINVEGFPPGIYLAVLRERQVVRASAKFVVMSSS